jgi:nitrogen-specific signal transduction histidine kinase
MINALPYAVIILNDKRQVVYSNEGLLKLLDNKENINFIGQKPGEFLNCVNTDCESGCGVSKFCRLCGASNSVLLSLMENRKVTDECRITAYVDGKEESFDFEVTASPLYFSNEKFVIYTLTDISGEKRKKVLERIFFHDILNTAGNVKGLTEIIQSTNDPGRKEELLFLLSKVSIELVDEIEAQKQLISAESGDLVPRREQVNSLELLESVCSQFSSLNQHRANISINKNSENLEFITDKSLLSRIIKNMIKNAVEASATKEEVVAGVLLNDKKVRFYVNNSTYIPVDVQLQIFNRSFSTKGIDRGLGTYSMKLLGERYLKGHVTFESKIDGGTSFFFDLPL